MNQIQTTLVGYEPRQVEGRNGTFTIHKFKSNDGTVFDTKKLEVSNAAHALMNQPVILTYTETQNGQWTNRTLEGVQTAFGGTTAAPSAAPSPQPQVSVAPTGDPTPARIARSVGQEHGLKALELALEAQKAGVAVITSPDEWIVTAAWISSAALTVAKDAATYIFNGSRSNSSPTAAGPSSGPGGSGAGADVQSAPAPASPAGGDDIPF